MLIFIVFLIGHIFQIMAQSSPGCFYTTIVTVFSRTGPNKPYTPQGYYNTFAFSVAQNNFQEHYFGLTAYKIGIQNISLSYECSLKNVTSTGAVIYFNPSPHSSIVSMQFFILLKQPCPHQLFMKWLDYEPKIINPTNPITSEQTEIYVDKPFGNGTNRYITQAYMSSFITDATMGAYFKISLALKPIQPGINYQKILINSDEQVLKKIQFVYILIDLYSYPQIPLFEIYTSTASSPPVTVSKYFAPNEFQKCIFGLINTLVKNVQTSVYDIRLAISPLKYDYYSIANNQINSSVLCMGYCYSWQYAYATSPSVYYNKCATCPISCLTCTNLTFCTICKTGYFLAKGVNFNQSCNPCLEECIKCNDLITCTQCIKGIETQNGCSIAQSCLLVNRSFSYNENRCNRCIHPSFLATNRTCICPVNYLMVTGLCTNVIGCSTTKINVDGSITCVACRFSDGFLPYPQNNRCICKDRYEIGGDKCVQKCGDGIRLDLQCDDGNNINMDGCSSTCFVESGFICTKRTNNGADTCVYVRRDISLLLKSVEKINLENKAIFTFTIFPSFINQKWVSIKNQSFFQTTQKIQILQTSIQNGQLVIFLQFFQDLENYSASIILNINNYLALQNNYTTTFKMQDNGKLVIITNTSILLITKYIYFSINLLIVIVFIVSMFVHKMIGLQLLFPIQILYMAFSFFGEESSVTSLVKFMGMSCFDLVSSFNLILNSYKTQDQLYNLYISFLTTSVFEIIIFLSCLIVFVMIKYSKNKESKKQLSEKLQKYYNYLLFPLSISLMINLQVYHSFCLFNNYISLLQKCLKIIVVILVILVYFFQWKIILTSKHSRFMNYETNDFKQRYIGAYLTFVFIFSTILYIWVIGYAQHSYIFLAVTSLSFICFSLGYKPYSKIFSNLGIIVNFLPAAFVIICIFLRNHKLIQVTSEEDSFLIMSIVIFLILSSVSTSIARIIIAAKQRFKNKEKASKLEIVRDQFQQAETIKMIRDINTMIKNDFGHLKARKPIQDQINIGDTTPGYNNSCKKDQFFYKNLKTILLEKSKYISNNDSFD